MESIDKIYCISLKKSIDRQKRFSENNPEIVNSYKFKWHIVDSDAEKKLGITPTESCFKNHIACVENARENNYSKIIIFEDDAIPNYSWDFIEKKINDIKYPEDWSYIMLGYLPIKTNKLSDDLYKVECAYQSHAYIVNIENANYEIKNIPIDWLFCKNKGPSDIITNPIQFEDTVNILQIYAIYPMLYKQENIDSNISSNFSSIESIVEFYGNYDNMIKFSSHVNIISFGIFAASVLIILFFIIVFLIVHYIKNNN